jgi:membrane protease YdiL (CAAX protease family)
VSQPGRLAHGKGVVARRRTSIAGPLAVLGAALVLRLVVAGTVGAASERGAALFAALLLTGAARAGWRPGRIRPAGLAWGLLGAAGLILGPAVLRLGVSHPRPHLPTTGFVVWALVVAAVAVAEEVLVRGVLFGAVEQSVGVKAALVITTILFALVHVPLYGISALPLDLAVGLWLGGLRVASGGVTAPATAHVLADLAGWWLW